MDNEAILRIKNSSKQFQEDNLQVSGYDLKIQESSEASLEIILEKGPSQDIYIPLSALKSNSSLQSVVFFLKERLGMNFRSIADLLNRDQRTIWSSYNKSRGIKLLSHSQYSFPINILRSRRLSVLESIVFYLRNELALSFNEIAGELGKNYRTIWTVYRRALAKIE